MLRPDLILRRALKRHGAGPSGMNTNVADLARDRRAYPLAIQSLATKATGYLRALLDFPTAAPRTGVEPVFPGRGPGVLLVKRTEHTA